ncbi:biliverdin-producing heme oxygenase [Chryseosolibacter indicus]|uniref:Biliverdin-producing heme oxygenase n=1 Tax=Chryseosolibacter indicus TaxID=2782351 RepID=A0ABS5VP19_9BACT|nr:biliverdin-producing heme oxygenase [Chryseosolibacter indicus]MBT1702896.1 biliverdin-producing heme oxygenase [Chryseosolibacter indicus]
MLHQHLKEQTAYAHQVLEKKLVTRIKNIRSVEDYATLLKVMYGYYAAIEIQIQPYITDESLLNFTARRKADSILDDISSFMPVGQLPLCTDLPVVKSYAQSLGVLYVLEGSTLGGQIIAKMIANQLNLKDKKGISFFLGYGEKTQVMWESFKEKLDQPFNDFEKEEIIGAANDTFITFKNWIDKQEILLPLAV